MPVFKFRGKLLSPIRKLGPMRRYTSCPTGPCAPIGPQQFPFGPGVAQGSPPGTGGRTPGGDAGGMLTIGAPAAGGSEVGVVDILGEMREGASGGRTLTLASGG